jgi:carboxypeptidase Q
LKHFFCFLCLLCAVPGHGAEPATRSVPTAPTGLDVRYHEQAERLIGAALSSDHAYARLSELCDGIGHRLSGSEALERAVAWAADAMRADQLDRVRLQAVKVPVWVRGEERAEMVEPGPQKLSILGLGRSVGTPPGGITAEVVVVNSFAQLDTLPAERVRGRIVLYDVPFTNYGETVRYRGQGANRAARRGAVAALVRSVGPVSLRTPHTGSMSDYVDSLPHIPSAAVTIEDATMMRRLVERGQRVRVRLEMGAQTRPDGRSHNVIGEIRGRSKPEEVVLIGGHLDSWDVGQGAHDDGGGCVISMEALRLMKSLGLRPRRTVRCVLWVNEENGVRGGAAYADSAHDETARHVAAIETDGGVERPIGFGVRVLRTDRDTSATDSTRTDLAASRMREIGRLLAGIGADGITLEGGGADITALMKKGVPGIGHRTTMEHYFDWHHTPADMLDKVDPIELRKNVAAVAVMLYVLADMPEPLAGFPAATKTAAARP